MRDYAPGTRRSGEPRLVDVLLRSEVMVYEPLWTLIPSNKAMLPVLWSLFPDHPYLLHSAFELGAELRTAGYVVKPIVGRSGSNIVLVDRDEQLLHETGGQFARREPIYQALCRLPHVDGYNVQLCTFSVGGAYAGPARVDRTLVITGASDVMALHVVDDERFGLFGDSMPADRQG